MYKIKTLNKIAKSGTDAFDRSAYSVSASEESPDAILVRSANMHDLQFNPELLCIARAGSGTNNIPADRCAEEGIVVFNTPGANSEAVKELVVCALLLSSRDILGGIDWVKTISGTPDVAAQVEAGKNAFAGPELSGKTLGVVGLGAVGAKIANDAARLGMDVYGYDPYLSVEAAWRLRTNIQHAKDLNTIYRTCDYISLHVPYIKESTHHLINAEAIAQMKPGARIINLARAELVDDDAIVAALAAGKLARYVTDFPNDKTAGAKGVIAIPHLGASTPESEEKCAVMAAEEIIDYLENGNIANSVNMPPAAMPRFPGVPRLCAFHKNVPDMIAKITGVISNKGINIENMLNAGVRGHDLAYTVIDVSNTDPGLKAAIEEIEGIIRVRVL